MGFRVKIGINKKTKIKEVGKMMKTRKVPKSFCICFLKTKIQDFPQET